MPTLTYKYNPDSRRFIPDGADDGVVSRYSFAVTRRKSNLTKKERLWVEAYEGDNLVASVEAKYTTLTDDLVQLGEYGVILKTSVFGKLRRAIEDNYTDLPLEMVDFDADLTAQVLQKLLELIYTSVKQGIKNEEPDVFEKEIDGVPVYSVAVGEFKSWLANSEYYQIDQTDLRKRLSKDGFIRTNAGRFDLTVKVGDKAKKCFVFYKKKLDEVCGK